MKGWIFRRLVSRDERKMLDGILSAEYFRHRRGKDAGKPKYTQEGEELLLKMEKWIR